jgi:hypothetical protein
MTNERDVCMVGYCDEPQATLGPCQAHLDESIAEEERRIGRAEGRIQAVEMLADLWEARYDRAVDKHITGRERVIAAALAAAAHDVRAALKEDSRG